MSKPTPVHNSFTGSVTEVLPKRYELIDKWGGKFPFQFPTALDAAKAARAWWPNEEQDEDRTGKGWDVQVVGA